MESEKTPTNKSSTFQTRIIDSYQLRTYEAVMDAVNQFCGSHDVVSVKSDVKKDDVIEQMLFADNGPGKNSPKNVLEKLIRMVDEKIQNK